MDYTPPPPKAMDDNLVEVINRSLAAQQLIRRDYSDDVECIMACRAITVDDFDSVQHYEAQKPPRLCDVWEGKLPTHNLTPSDKVILLAKKLRFSFNPYHSLSTSREFISRRNLKLNYHLSYIRDPHDFNLNWECPFKRWDDIYPFGEITRPKQNCRTTPVLQNNLRSRPFYVRKPV